MLAPNRHIRLRFAPSRVASYFKSAGSLRTAALLTILFGVLAITFYSPSSATSFRKRVDSRTTSQQNISKISETATQGASQASLLSLRKGLNLTPLTAPFFVEGIATYSSDCATPQTDFNLGDVVCAKASGVPVTLFPWHVLWLDPAGNVRQSATASTSDAFEYHFTVPSTATSEVNGQTVDNRGTWQVNLVRSNGAVRQTARFVVHDTANLVTDLFVQKINRSADGSAPAGGIIDFIIVVGNAGPDAATNVHLVDSIPSGGTLVSFTGTTTCAPIGNGPANDCIIATMAYGQRAEFTAVYNVGAAAPGTYTTSATVVPPATDTKTDNNTSTTQYTVTSGGGGTCELICPDNINALANTTEGGQRGVHVTYTAPASSGVCGSVSSTPASGSFFHVGTTTVTATSGTGGGACSFTVTVVDNSDNPTISCPPNKNVDAAAGACSATVDPGSPTTTGTGVTVSGERSDGEPLNQPYPGGTTTIVWTATDSQDRTASCSQTITVHTDDTLPPTITAPPDVTTSTGSDALSCGLIVGETELGTADVVVSDNCGNANVSRTGVPAGNFFPVGTTTITYTATDGAGNTATDTQTVTVTDNSPPRITATAPNPNPPPATEDVPIQDVTVHTGPNSTSCDAVVSDADLGNVQVRDNCAGSTLSRTPSGNTFSVGTTTITWSATDAHGNMATAIQTVTVIDDTPPTITAPADSSAFADANCQAPVPDYRPGTTAADNCGSVTLSQSPAPGTLVGYGPHTITVTANDGHGNTASDDVVFTVNDNTPPVFTSCPTNVTKEASCPTGAIATYATPTATDNCGAAAVTQTAGPASGAVFPIGTTTVTHVANDGHGNTATCTFTVTVLTPQAILQNLITSVNASSLTGTQKNGLLAKLNAALDAINEGKQNVACNKLSDFVNSVGTLIDHGDITAAQGNAWISSANHVRNVIGCTNLGCS